MRAYEQLETIGRRKKNEEILKFCLTFVIQSYRIGK
jgi:hypothetical protein